MDVHLTLCAYIELARGKVWPSRKARQRELAMDLPGAKAIVVRVIAFAPLRVPEAWRITSTVNDPTSAVPAVVIERRVGIGWDDCRQGAAGPANGVVHHFNSGARTIVPRTPG